jgi:hypothetical protein
MMNNERGLMWLCIGLLSLSVTCLWILEIAR